MSTSSSKSNIKLRKIKKSDAPFFLKWWKDKNIISLTSGFFEKSDKILTNYFLNIFKNKRDRHYIILLKNRAIGHIALINKNSSTFEINVVIGEKKYWGKGYGTEAIGRAVKIAFSRLNYLMAYLEVRPDNVRAIKAYEACGFVKKGFKKYSKNNYQPIVLKMILKNSPK